MAPIAAAAMVMLAANAVVSVFAGALIGAIVWRLRVGLVWGAGGVVAYLLVAPGLVHHKLLPFAGLNGPSTIMTFLICCLLARHLGIRRNWHPLWATVVAFVVALGCGAAWVRLLGELWSFDLWAASWVAVVVDVGLAVLAIRSTRAARKLIREERGLSAG